MNSPLIDWFFERRSELGLSFNYLEAPYGLIQCETFFSDGEFKYPGQSFSKNKKEALLKALAEMIERYYCISNKLSSDGIAVHTNVEKAQIHSVLELIEKDALAHYFFFNLKPIQIPTPSSYESIQKRVKFYSLPTLKNAQTVLCIYFDNNNGISLGAKSVFGDNLSLALGHAFMEAFIKVEKKDEILKEKSLLNLEDFQHLKEIGIVEHFRLGLSSTYSEQFLKQLNTGTKLKEEELINIETLNISHKNIELPKIFSSSPVLINKAQSDDLLQLKYGLLQENDYLENRYGKEKINSALPHCFA